MNQDMAHVLRYTREPGELGQTNRDVFVLISPTMVTVADRDSAVSLLFGDGELPFDIDQVSWLPFEHGVLIPLVKQTSGWFTSDGVTAVLTKGEGPEHPRASSDVADGGVGTPG